MQKIKLLTLLMILSIRDWGVAFLKGKNKKMQRVKLLFIVMLQFQCGILLFNPQKGDNFILNRILPFLAVYFKGNSVVNISNAQVIAPAILSEIPAANSSNIPIDQRIIITFTEKVIPISNPITISYSGGNPISGIATWNNDVLEYKLNTNLEYNTLYTITLSSSIKNTFGNPIVGNLSYKFTTISSPDVSFPTIIGTTPASGALNFNVDSSLAIVFSEPILLSSFNLTNITVTNAGNPVSIAVNANGSNGNIVPVGGWTYSTNYVVTLRKEIQDFAENKMTSDYTFTFTTQADTNSPRVVSQIPETYAVTPPLGLTVPGHSINDPIQIIFDKEILVSSVTSSSFIVKQGVTPIAGTISVYPPIASGADTLKNYKIKFTPLSRLPLTNGVTTPITVTLTTGIQDISGNALSAPYTFTFETKYTSLSTHYFYSCVLLPSGKVRCWGSNITGQLGTGDFDPVTTMSAAKDLRIGEPVLKIATGASHVCALLLSGRVKCWGNGFNGALGNGGLSTIADPYYSPMLSLDEKITDLKAGAVHTCVVTESGKFRCWGDSPTGQLGNANLDSKHSMSDTVSLTFPADPVKEIVTGSSHTCALTTNGNVKCWGENTAGQLGVPIVTSAISSDSVGSAYMNLNLGGALPTHIYSMHNHICATLNSGDAKCWGWSDYGQIGTALPPPVPILPSNYNSATLLVVPAMPVRTITKMVTGIISTCSIFTDGTMTCWGDNTFMELGFPTSVAVPNPETLYTHAISFHPISFLPGNKIVDAAIGSSHGCLVIDTDQIRCWGTGINYVLGNGNASSIASVTGVGFPALPFYSFTRMDY